MCIGQSAIEFSVVVPASSFLLQRMAGLSGVARSVILADLAGARSIYVVSAEAIPRDWERSFAARARPRPEVVPVASIADIPDRPGSRLIVLPEDRLLTLEGMCRLRDGGGDAALCAPVHALDARAPGDMDRAIFESARKGGEGWFLRNIDRPISFRIASFLLRRWDISPNTVTWFGLALALAMVGILAHGGLVWLAVGGALYQAVMVVDCVDGDIARLTYTSSRLGAALDTGFDMVSNLGFVTGLMIGLVRTYGYGELAAAAGLVGMGALCILAMTVLDRLGPKRGNFDVLRSALAVRLERQPRLRDAVLLFERLFKRDFYALFAATLCLLGLAWMLPWFGLAGVCIWLLAIVWCAPVIVADKTGELLPAHLKLE